MLMMFDVFGIKSRWASWFETLRKNEAKRESEIEKMAHSPQGQIGINPVWSIWLLVSIDWSFHADYDSTFYRFACVARSTRFWQTIRS
jgi:hypothetical protein